MAIFAAVVSYDHIYTLGRAHGQAGAAGALLPLSVDGLILAASLMMLHEANAGRTVPPLARAMMALGVGATVAANVAYGITFGLVGAVISAWPSIAFIGSAEMLMIMISRARGPVVQTPEPPAQEVPANVEAAALQAYTASRAAGAPLSQRAIAEDFGISRRTVARLVSGLNGSSS